MSRERCALTLRALAVVAMVAVVASSAGCGSDGDDSGDGGDPGDDGAVTDGGAPDASVASDAARPRLPRGSYPLLLQAGAFAPVAGHPNALVVIPQGFDPTPPLAVIVYIHGFENCIENVVRDVGQACTTGGPVRGASNLTAQLEASGKNALLLLPEVAFDQRSGATGKLGNLNGLRDLVAEALTALATPLGAGRTVADLGKVLVVSHSGGYTAAAAVARRGGIPISEVHLLDSLYGLSSDFEAWALSDTAGLTGSPPRRRFADVYTTSGGTLANSEALADRARTWVPGMPDVFIDDRTTATWTEDRFRHGLLFKHSALSHDGVPRYYFEKLLTNSDLPAR